MIISKYDDVLNVLKHKEWQNQLVNFFAGFKSVSILIFVLVSKTSNFNCSFSLTQ